MLGPLCFVFSYFLLMCMLVSDICSVILRGFIVLLGCGTLNIVCLFFVRFSMFVDWFSLCFPSFWVWARPLGQARFRFVHFSFISCFGLVCVWCVVFCFWVPLMMF